MEYSWAAYSGMGRLMLVLILVVVTVGFALIAFRLRRPVPGPTASGGTVFLLVVGWLLAIVTFVLDIGVYGLQAREVHLTLPSPPNHVTPVTLTCAAVSFVVVALTTRTRVRTRLANALLCACVGPMVFELPFDLIVMTHTSAIPPVPWLYVALFFLPLFAIEVLTIALAVTRPGVRFTRWSAGWFAGMIGVFAVWAVIGFEYPLSGLPLALNIVSKVLAFLVALSLFLHRDRVTAEGRGAAGASKDRPEHAPTQVAL